MTPWTGSIVREASAAEQGSGSVEIEVLAFSSNDAVDEAAALTDAFKHALIGAPGVTDHGKSHALEAVALTAGCDDPGAASCAPKIASEIKWNTFIYGTVKKTPPNKITATLHYYNNGQIKTVAKTYDAGPIAKDGASPELKKIALDALFAVLGGAPKGKVEVTVTGPAANEDGELFDNGQKVGTVTAGKGIVDLPSGNHTIELRVKGYASTTGQVEVTPAGTSVTLSPVKLAPSKPLDWQLYGGIGAIVVGAVFIGVGAATSISVNNYKNDANLQAYRDRWPKSDPDVCVHAHAGQEAPAGTTQPTTSLAPQVAQICDDSSSKEKMQWVWYGVGAVLAAGGTILVLTDKHSDDTPGKDTARLRVKLQPVVTPQGSSFSLVGSF